MSDATRLDVVGGVATITLDQPDNRNALTAELVDSLGDHLHAAFADPSARVIVLTNEGSVFCAGADLKREGESQPRYSFVALLEAVLASPKPIVARVAGHCFGGGVGLAAACDISIASSEVLLSFSEVRLGVAPAIISVVVLPKLRRGDALDLFLSGRRIEATRAADLGLITRAVPGPELDSAIGEVAADLLAGGPNALAAAKQLVREVPAMPMREAFAWAEAFSAELFASEEAAAGIAAFRQKTAPPWIS